MGISYYLGIDFANRDKNVGRCYVKVDSTKKTVTPELNVPKGTAVAGTSVDCPFGTTIGFEALLKGDCPSRCDWDKGYKTRATEHWLRTTLWDFQSNQYWRNLSEKSGQQYFRPTGHVQSTLRIVMVPAFMNWFYTEDSRKLEDLVQARLGKSEIVESHPRPFLYSAIERIFVARTDFKEWESTLRKVVTYKDKKTESHSEQRKSTYEFLKLNSSNWLWDGYKLTDPPDNLFFVSDHLFDAFLAALTSFAHTAEQTISWQAASQTEPGITEAVVKVEGHIHVLSQQTDSSSGAETI